MKVSLKWLNKYFDDLPEVNEISEAFSKHLTEVEEIEEKGEDTVFDIKILPDRACYALSHLGIAGELSAINNIPLKILEAESFSIVGVKPLNIEVEEKELCQRYIGRRIDGIQVRESVPWLKEKLENIGQRSINNIVDTLNYVMFDVGQPLHAFDADKVEGKIIVRFAKDGEKITTLDGKEVVLNSKILVIADEKDPLAIAGIKGGKKAEVDFSTKNIIIESANFNKSQIRTTSTRINIKTDASKRYENGLSPKFCEIGMEFSTSYIAKFNPDSKVGESVDVYSNEGMPNEIQTSAKFINDVIGIEIDEKEIKNILERLKITVTENKTDLLLTPPFERLDLNLPEDIAEEVARLYGYEKIPSKQLEKSDIESQENQSFIWIENIKEVLIGAGFSEILTHTLSNKGDLEIEKSFADDKNFLRNNLSDNMTKALSLNLYNAPLLGLNQIKLFEIGKVFPKLGEYTSLCVGIANAKGYKGESINEQIRQTREYLLEKINAKIQTLCTIDDTGGILVLKGKQIGKINDIDGIMELNLDALVSSLPTPNLSEFKNVEDAHPHKYKSISPYPFVLRDIALWVPQEADQEEVKKMIESEAGELLVRIDLFDTFQKGEKTSLAYRLVFQSMDKTLTDEEINQIMIQISNKMAQQGFEIR